MVVSVASITLILNRVRVSSAVCNINMRITSVIVLEEEFILTGDTCIAASLVTFTISNRSSDTSSIGIFVVSVVTFRTNKTILSGSGSERLDGHTLRRSVKAKKSIRRKNLSSVTGGTFVSSKTIRGTSAYSSFCSLNTRTS